VSTALVAGRVLEWDSHFWGVTIAEIEVDALQDIDLAQRWLDAESVRCTYLHCPAEHLAAVRDAERIGFRVMDVRVDFERAATPTRLPSAEIREAQPSDLPALRGIARSSHRDTRFYADPHFDDARCDDLYETWIANSCAGFADWVLVVDGPSGAIGYCTGHRDAGGSGRIGLVAVDERERSRGWGARLLDAAIARFAADGMHTVRVATQARNLAAQRAYERCGFRVRSVEYVLHRWSGDA